MNRKRYFELGDFLKSRFDFKVQKISVNAGFTCPNRDGTVGTGGCTYCNNQTFSPEYCQTNKSISRQISEGIEFFSRKYPEMKYLAYFQSYTNTYGKLTELTEKYEEALAIPGVVGLIIGTRPDCMPDKLLDYLTRLAQKTFVLIEYGVESTYNSTLQYINRGHDFETAKETICKTAAAGILTGAHLILGLPGEDRNTILSHAEKISCLPLTTLKLHQLQLIRHTHMARQYMDLAIDFAERLNPGIVIERFVSQSPKELLIAPQWGLKNYEFTARLLHRMQERDTYQGKYYTPEKL